MYEHAGERGDGACDDVRELTDPGKRAGQPGEMFRADGRDTRVREPDGVDHPAAEFSHTWRRRALARLGAHRLGDESPERGEVHDVGVLVPVRMGALGE